MLRHLKVPEEEVEGFTDQIKERKMGELFECFKDIDLSAARKKQGKKVWPKEEPKIKRVMGIEPTYPAWKAGVLPLNYTRI